MLKRRVTFAPRPARLDEFGPGWKPRPRTIATAIMLDPDAMTTSYPKDPERIDYEPYRRLVASMPCIHCTIEGHSQAAHPNTGKAKSAKADDTRCFPLCTVSGNDCHGQFDSYKLMGRVAQSAIEPTWGVRTLAVAMEIAKTDRKARAVMLELSRRVDEKLAGWMTAEAQRLTEATRS